MNTVPFLYGIRHSEWPGVRLLLSPPAGCAEAFSRGEADIALVPVGALGGLADYDVVTDWCIGAAGPVRTVVMVSDVPMAQIERVWMDDHSMTSVKLAQILAKRYWKISPKFYGGERDENDAAVLIGDKVFEAEGRFGYSWDLASEWIACSGLPMVFAVWVARKGVAEDALTKLDTALTLGVERVYEAIEDSEFKDREYAYDYLTRNIDYFFDQPKRRALEKFLGL